MQEIENKKRSFIGKIVTDFRAWRREKCFCFRNIIYKLTKNMCFEKEELEEIEERVKVTKESEEKFNKWEGIMPKVKEHILALEERANALEKEKMFCLNGIREIYIADVQNDSARKRELFAQFGLPFVLENE